ncbi:MAG: hypothetical protein EXR85_01125 [Xanthomonadales bacterium]|nr:hypothetical protein [Xanthomonadales bacterium]
MTKYAIDENAEVRASMLTGVWCAAIISCLTLAACTPTAPPPAEGDTAFTGINVVDVNAGAIVPDQTVVIADGRIVQIAPANAISLAPDVSIVDGAGKYLAPGLMDMHAHVFTESSLIPYLANGITTVRNMWGSVETLAMREAVAAGRLPGPRIYTAGGLLDGAPKIWAGSTEVTDPASVDAIVAQQAADGYDFVKIYSRLSPAVFDAIIAAGKKHGIEVSGHVPQDVPFLHAIGSGMRTSEHFLGALWAVLSDPSLSNPDLSAFDDRSKEFILALGRGEVDAGSLVDPERVAALGSALAKQEFWLVPTQDVMKSFTHTKRQPHPETVRFMSPVDRQLMKMLEDPSFQMMPEENLNGEDVLFQVRSELLFDLYQAGARILVGTDDSLQSGFVVVDEMEALADVGLAKADVLRAATSEPANYLRKSGELGVIAVGAAADLILIEGNPLENLEALRLPTGVMRAGVWYTRQQLDEMLEVIAAQSDAIEAEFADAPAFPADAGVSSDFLGGEDGAVRIATSQAEGVTTVTAAIRNQGEWNTTAVTAALGSVSVAQEGQADMQTVKSDGGWQLKIGNDLLGTPSPGDIATVLTGTPADILILNAVAGQLGVGETLDLVMWRCGAGLDCTGAEAEAMTVTGLGPQIINGHRIFESANAFRIREPGGSAAGSIDFWYAPPALYSGGPVRIEFDGVNNWRRVR